MMTFLNVICYCAFAAAIIALPFLLNWVRYMKAQPVNRLVVIRSGFPTKSVSFFVIPILIAGVAGSIIVSAWKELAPYWAHHSHPTKRIRVDIRTDVRDLRLELGRDSENLQEYWVFYPELDREGGTMDVK